MKCLLFFVIALIIIMPIVSSLTLGEGVRILVNSSNSSSKYYLINNTITTLDNFSVNNTHFTIYGLETSEDRVRDVDNDEILCSGNANCQLPSIGVIKNIIFESSAIGDIYYILGPLSTDVLIFNQPHICYSWQNDTGLQPENQTNVQGIFNLTNNGTGTANTFTISTDVSPPGGWSIYCHNSTSSNLTISDIPIDICTNISKNDSCMVWCYANCNIYITQLWNPEFVFDVT